jgi:hypothetical protein
LHANVYADPLLVPEPPDTPLAVENAAQRFPVQDKADVGVKAAPAVAHVTLPPPV